MIPVHVLNILKNKTLKADYFVQMVAEWKPPGGRMISVCGCNVTQIVCASGPVLFYLEVKEGELTPVADTTLEHEVACIDLTPLDDR